MRSSPAPLLCALSCARLALGGSGGDKSPAQSWWLRGECPGEIKLDGHGDVSLVPTGWVSGDGPVEVEVHHGRAVAPHMGSRVYFADACTAGAYDHKQYLALNLLGKTLRYTTDMSGAGCGCNAALYLTSMRQNPRPSECSDYYCDANSVCGESCAEIDIQEGNQFAWHSTLHTSQDGAGAGAGYGGGDFGWSGPRDWARADYGPGARCIDTSAPFEVAVSFPVNDQGSLASMDVTLTQAGSPCPLSISISQYGGLGELSQALAAGMTPIISYWNSTDMQWMDGAGQDGQGPCQSDSPPACSDSVQFSNFSVQSIAGPSAGRGAEPGGAAVVGGGAEAEDEPAFGSVVEQHGRLRVQGNKIVGRAGTPVRLRGVSLFWSQWMDQYWNEDVVRWLRDDWHATLIRAPMGVEEGGYLENPRAELAKIERVVKACIAAGIYVIVDWHDHHASSHPVHAKYFFSHMAKKYGHHPNVMFEVFNEPIQEEWATSIRPYHEMIVPHIRKHTDNLIILGTREWSQDVDEASSNPVHGENLAYTVHFYAASHGQYLRDKVSTALNSGVAIFATEWGSCEASGNGRIDFQETQAWLDFFEQHHISDANWAISDKAESCSALRDGASGRGGWGPDMLTESGAFVRASLRTSLPHMPKAKPTTHAGHRKFMPPAWAMAAAAAAVLGLTCAGALGAYGTSRIGGPAPEKHGRESCRSLHATPSTNGLLALNPGENPEGKEVITI